MNAIYALIPLSIILLALAIWAFNWAVKSKQFDDLERSGSDIFFDDDDEFGTVPIPTEMLDKIRQAFQMLEEADIVDEDMESVVLRVARSDYEEFYSPMSNYLKH